jgi:hypothetical protein
MLADITSVDKKQSTARQERQALNPVVGIQKPEVARSWCDQSAFSDRQKAQYAPHIPRDAEVYLPAGGRHRTP